MALGELEEMGVMQHVVAYLELIFVQLGPLGLPAARVAQAELVALVASVATAVQSRPSGLGPLRAALLAMAPMAKQAKMDPLAPPELQVLMQLLQFLMPLVSQRQPKRALQVLPEHKELVVPPVLTARWVEVFLP